MHLPQNRTPIMTALTLVQDQAYHITGIKNFHSEVRAAETSAAIAAWHAGYHAAQLQDTGLSLRKLVEATGIPLVTLHRYLKVFRRRNSPTEIRMGESISSIIDEAIPSKREQTARAATFGAPEAEYAVKLQSMAESNSPHEAAIAAKKLDQFAADHGMTKEQVVEKSRKTLDLDWIEAKQQMGTAQFTVTDVIETKFSAKSKPDLIKIIIEMVMQHPENLGTLKGYLDA
jgi:hypothetical protein